MDTIDVNGLPEPVVRSLENLVAGLKEQFSTSPANDDLNPLERMKRAAGSWADADDDEFNEWLQETYRAEDGASGAAGMSFLLDTDVCSGYLRNPGPLFHRFVQHSGQLNVSVITLAELYAWTLGRRTSPKYQAGLNDMLQKIAILDFDHAIVRRFGEVRAQLLDQGQSAPPMDMLIAATALVHGLTVVTHNVADFSHLPGFGDFGASAVRNAVLAAVANRLPRDADDLVRGGLHRQAVVRKRAWAACVYAASRESTGTVAGARRTDWVQSRIMPRIRTSSASSSVRT